jgi:phosphotransferase system HPr (HPr) family protein
MGTLATIDAGDVMTQDWLEKEINLTDKHSLHLRPAQRIVEIAGKFKSDVRACKDAVDLNAKSILDMIDFVAHMARNTDHGDNTFCFRAHGDDASAALEALANLVDDRFGLE